MKANLLTRKQIADLIGQTPQYIGTYIRRKKLIESTFQGKKYIDTELRENKLFIAKFTQLDALKKVVSNVQQIEVKQKNTRKKTSSANETPAGIKQQKALYDLDHARSEWDLKLKKVKVKKEELDLAKKAAKLIEVNSANEIMQRSVVVLSNKYRQESKQFLNILAAKYNIPDSDLSGIQKEFDDTINRSVSEARDLIKSECEIMASELAGTLGIGESL